MSAHCSLHSIVNNLIRLLHRRRTTKPVVSCKSWVFSDWDQSVAGKASMGCHLNQALHDNDKSNRRRESRQRSKRSQTFQELRKKSWMSTDGCNSSRSSCSSLEVQSCSSSREVHLHVWICKTSSSRSSSLFSKTAHSLEELPRLWQLTKKETQQPGRITKQMGNGKTQQQQLQQQQCQVPRELHTHATLQTDSSTEFS